MPTSADAFADPAWNALHSTHAHLAQTHGLACKYPRDVAPFAAIDTSLSPQGTLTALHDLHALLIPNETTYLVGPEPPIVEGLFAGRALPCVQMVLAQPLSSRLASSPSHREDAAARVVAATIAAIAPLTCADGPAMVALTDLAFPGFFRPNTCRMGSYFGIWSSPPDRPRRLIAMAGERLCPFPFREISAVCTHPDYRGKGYAAQLITHLVEHHRTTNALSALHVAATNHRAIELYLRLGFVRLREILLHPLTRSHRD